MFAAAAVSALFFGCGAEEKNPAATPSPSALAPQGASSAPAQASVRGTVRLRGKPRPRAVIKMTGQPYCVAHHPNGMPSDELVVSQEGFLRDAIVHVSGGLPDVAYPAPVTPAVLDQVGCWYLPHALSLTVGQPLEIRNADDTMHNVHGRPKANRPFNFSQPKKGMVRRVTFDTPELPVPVKCDVHGWMNAVIGVFAHPFHAVSGADGSFSIGGLAPGRYELTCWHAKLGTRTAKFVVPAEGFVRVEIEYAASR